MWVEFRKALSNPTLMQWFYNMRLGLPFTSPGNSIPVELLVACSDTNHNMVITPESAYIPEDCHSGPCSMGIDVAAARLDVRISSIQGGKRRAVYFGKLLSPTRWEDIITLGERYNVQSCVIDHAPEGENAIQFKNTAPFPVWRINYQGAGTSRNTKYNHADRIITIDRTVALDRAYSQLKTKKNILPANFKSIFAGAFVDEMISLTRNLSEDNQGNARYEWEGAAESDHSRHADAYDLLAAEIIMDDVIDSSNMLII
jgi:hypothetical protein